MTNEEKEIILSIFGRFNRDDYIGMDFDVPTAIQDYGRLPLTDAVREVAWDIIRKTEFTLKMESGGGAIHEEKLS